MKRIAFAVVTVVLGACAGAFCWAFFFLMNAGLDLLWVKAPAWLAAIGMPAVVYPLAFCVAGGVAIGLFQKNVGPYPDDMNAVLAEVKKTGRYEYRHLGAMFVRRAPAASVRRQHRARGRPHRRGGGALQLGGGTDSSSWAPRCASWRTRARRPFCRRSSRPRCSAWRRRCSAMRTMPTGVGAGAARSRCDGGFRAPGFQTGQNGGVPALRGRGAGGVHAAQRGGWRRFGAAALLRHGRGDIRARLGASRRRARRLRRLALSWLRLGRGQAVRAARRSRRSEGGRCRCDTGSSRDLPPLYPVRRRGPDRDAGAAVDGPRCRGRCSRRGFSRCWPARCASDSVGAAATSSRSSSRGSPSAMPPPGSLTSTRSSRFPSARQPSLGASYAPAADGGLAAHPVLSRESRRLRPCRCVLGRRRSGSEGVLSGLILCPGDAPCRV